MDILVWSKPSISTGFLYYNLTIDTLWQLNQSHWQWLTEMTQARTQLPLKLTWAITAHKSQGLTLPCVEVHCGNEFTSGQYYVSWTKAKESKGLSLVGFSKAWLIPPPNVVVYFYSKLDRDDRIALSRLFCNNAKLFDEVFEPPMGIDNVYLGHWGAEDE